MKPIRFDFWDKECIADSIGRLYRTERDVIIEAADADDPVECFLEKEHGSAYREQIVN